MVACLVAGIAAYSVLERELNPATVDTGATVTVNWPGASPTEIEQQIVLRIEEAIDGIDGLKHVDSTAREGFAQVIITGDTKTDKTRFLNELKNRIDGISTLPNGVEPPIVSQLIDQTPGIFMAVQGNLTPKGLNALAREVRNELSKLPGGSPIIEIWGNLNEEVAIEVSEETLRQYGLTFDDVANAIRGSSLNVAGGQVRTETGNLQIAARALADTEQDFEKIVVRQNSDGSLIRVGDIATVIDGIEDVRSIRKSDGRPSISIAVRPPERANVTKMSKVIHQYVEEKNKELGDQAKLRIWFDAADPFNGQLSLVTSNAVLGLILVLIVLTLFLRPTVAIWVSIGIGVSFIGAFILMPATGVSLNLLSIFGFLLVIGIVVDDAIIVGESIHNQVENGTNGVDGAILGTQLVVKPVFFAVVTTMIAFLPWLLISGAEAELTKQISLTIIFALSFSLIEAFLILPAHLAHLEPQDKTSRFYQFQRRFAEGIVNFANRYYEPVIKWALINRYFTVAGFSVALMLSIALVAQGWVPFKFTPTMQGSFISAHISLPEGTSFTRTEQIFDNVEDAANRLKQKLGNAKNNEPYVRSIYVAAEEISVRSYVTITEAVNRDESTEDIARLFEKAIGPLPDAESVEIGFTQNNNSPDLSYGIEANSLEDLRIATDDVRDFLRTLPGVFNVRTSLQSSSPELQLFLKPGAERFGLTLGEVSKQVRQAFYGEEVQRLPREGQDVRVLVRYPKEARESLSTIDTMRIRTADGREVPLTVVADAQFAPSYKKIDRRDRQRSAKVTARMVENIDRSAVKKAFSEEYAANFSKRHPNATLSIRGDGEKQADFVKEFNVLYSIALFSIYMLLAIAFSSYWQPALIMTAIPFGYMGGAFGHFFFGLDFTLFSFFGVGAAAGVVINDNLVLIDYVNRLRASGAGAFEALVRAGVGRFRPIILTSFTTFIGLLPIMFEQSTDAEFLKPTIVALAFGVFFATFVTLIFVPAMYAVGADIARFYRWAWTGQKQPDIGTGASAERGFTTTATTSGKLTSPDVRPAE